MTKELTNKDLKILMRMFEIANASPVEREIILGAYDCVNYAQDFNWDVKEIKILDDLLNNDRFDDVIETFINLIKGEMK